MTAHELARRLLEGPDLMVTVSGYEGGVDEVTHIMGERPLHINVNTAWYYGKHEFCNGGCLVYLGTPEIGPPKGKAVHIG